LRLILDLGEFYLSDFAQKKKPLPEKFPLTLVICESCRLLQLRYTTPPKKLYTQGYGYRSGINNTMRKELSQIVEKALKVAKLKKGDLVIDIGANDGTLLSFYPKGTERIAVEPIKKFAKEARQYAEIVIIDYFRQKSLKKALRNKKAKVITAISMFYDIDSPNSFLSDVKFALEEQGVFIIQQNYLVRMLRLNAFDNIVHEHLEYYSLYSLENLLEKNGMRVFNVEETSINGGSFRTYICLNEAKYKTSKRVIDMRTVEKKLKLDHNKPYDEFAKRVQKSRKKIRSYIEKEAKKGRETYVYGASTRGNTLLQYFGLNSKLIPKAVERNPEKWGKYISSVGIPIISEEQARIEMPENMLVLPWFFKDEFIKREGEYLRKGGKLIFPLPKFEIADRSNS
jgi:hypothetical protein